jgi:tRNA/tmRNA/rRNA uracil-C5-methylase (TrmA/RlmC/RlmD family)
MNFSSDNSFQFYLAKMSSMARILSEESKTILILDPSQSELPATWEQSAENKMRFTVPNTSEEYRSIISNFDQIMRGKYAQIIRLERIQNERWYLQYLAHSRDFRKRLNADTEKRLYHGCPEQAANSIIEGCFNRSYAGINGN